jgi:hypothetical protein
MAVRIALIATLVAFIGFSVWARVDGPCSMFQYTSVKNLPARCAPGVTK